jgi:hypothetical protein
MRQDARVVEKFPAVDVRLGDVLEAHHEELQRPSLVDRKQFLKGLHSVLRTLSLQGLYQAIGNRCGGLYPAQLVLAQFGPA